MRQTSHAALALMLALSLPAPPPARAQDAQAPAAQTGAGESATTHRLAPEDEIRLRVVEWRPAADDILEWKAINGLYVVQADGLVSIPLLGLIPARGRAPSELAKALAEGLTRRMKLALAPDVAVEVSRYAPVYVAGDVVRPGAFPFQPGLTVIKATALAGGLPRLPDAGPRIGRELIVSRTEQATLEAEIFAALARAARARAELDERDAFTPPPALQANADDPRVVAVLAQERAILAEHVVADRTQTETLRRLVSFLDSEVESLQGQAEAEGRQAALIAKELQGVKSLVEKGLSVAPRQLALERLAAQADADKLRVNSSVLKARQEISRAELDILAIRNRRRAAAADELREAEQRLEVARARRAGQRRLMAESLSAGARFATAVTQRQARYVLRRQESGLLTTLDAAPDDAMRSGDTLEVILPSPALEEIDGLDATTPSARPASQAPPAQPTGAPAG